MAAHRNVQNFYELRQGLLGMREFVDAALGYLDANGIALSANGTSRRVTPRPKPVPIERLREEVKRRYTRRAPAALNTKPPAPPTLRPKERLIQQRQATANTLAQFDTVESRQVQSRILGVLVRRGYLKRKGDGYVRTAKEYVVMSGHKSLTATSAAPALMVGGTNVGVNGHSASVAPNSRITMAEAAGILKLTDSGVRSLVDRKKLRGHWEPRVRRGFTKAQKALVVERDEVVQLAAARAAH